MRRALSWLAVLALPAVLLLGSPANAQKKKGTAEKDLDDKNTEKLIKSGVLVGKVMNVYEGSRKVRLQVAVPVTTLNTGAISSMQQAQLQLAVARARGDALGMRQAQLMMVREQLNLYRTELKSVDVEVEARDDAIVRTARPKADFDDKGRVKKLTRAQLKELKGPDPKLPGYKAEFGDVATDQIIRVQLVRKKGAAKPALKTVPKPQPKKKGKAKDLDKDVAADVLGDNSPQVSMIIILGEANPGG
jgi:hypothetical protein